MNYTGVLISCKGEWQEILIAELSVLPFDTFEEKEDGIGAYIPSNQFDKKAVAEIIERYQEHIEMVDYQEIEKVNWNEEWEKNYDPVMIDKSVIIRALFHPSIEGFEYEIVINPKMSFGTGHHATTHLMIKAQLEFDHKGKKVADFGTGTGVLAIMAYKLGAKSLLLTDVDDWCIENSTENLSLNGIEEASFLQGPIKTLDLKETFDIILANINKNVLLDELESYVNCLEKDGVLFLSGFYEDDCDDLIQLAQKYNLKHIRKEIKDRWATLQFKK